MSKRKKRTSAKVVPHPRYGASPMHSGYTGSEQEVRDSFWAYQDARIFVESAIPADLSRQNFATMGRGFYVDIFKTCRECQRQFIFFALEQQFWYEELGFYIDSDCVRCIECRNNSNDVQRVFERYSENIGNDQPNDETLVTLVGDAVFLWENMILQNEHKIRRLRNLAVRKIPNHSATSRIVSLVDSL